MASNGHQLGEESVVEGSQVSIHLEGLPEATDLYCMMPVVVTRKTMILASFSLLHCSQGSALTPNLRHPAAEFSQESLMPNNRATSGVRIEKRVRRKWSGMRIGPWPRTLGSRRHVGNLDKCRR